MSLSEPARGHTSHKGATTLFLFTERNAMQTTSSRNLILAFVSNILSASPAWRLSKLAQSPLDPRSGAAPFLYRSLGLYSAPPRNNCKAPRRPAIPRNSQNACGAARRCSCSASSARWQGCPQVWLKPGGGVYGGR